MQHSITDPAEEWRAVPGYDGRYEVSSWARVRRRSDGRHLSRSVLRSGGYPAVSLNRQKIAVHLIVGPVFLGDPDPSIPGRPVIRHLNGDPTDCRPENLAWGSESENARDRVAHGRDAYARRDQCSNGHRYTPENTYRRPSKPNVRRCRTCDRAYRQARALAGVA